jgi:predicted PurR-regulated permease PerM
VSREQLFAAFFFAVFLFLLYQAYLFLSVFFAPIVWAGILALTFFPLTSRLVRVFGGRHSLAAFTLVVVVTVGAILPSVYLGSLLVNQATGAYHRLEQAMREGDAWTWLDTLRASRLGALWARVMPVVSETQVDASDMVLRATNWLSTQIVNQATSLARNALLTVANFLLMLVALFFFFRDGEAMSARLRDLLPMEPEHKDAVFARLYTTVSAVVQSMVLTAVMQGLLAGIGYALIGGITFSVFLGFLTGLASFLPLAGPAFIWGGTAAYLALTGSVGRAVGLLLWGTLLVSTADNLIKPLIIGERAKLPTFLLLISILGGLQIYGFLGVFLGPVILATLIGFVDIYQEVYRAVELPASPLPPEIERAPDARLRRDASV